VTYQTWAPAAACGLALFVTGCAHTAPATKSTAQERQDRAMKDPFGYKPDWSNSSISGGGTADLDKDGLHKDLDHVLNP
jgi:hypothetical protein